MDFLFHGVQIWKTQEDTFFSPDTHGSESTTYVDIFLLFSCHLKHFVKPLQVKIRQIIKTGASGTGVFKSENFHFIWIKWAYDPPKIIF